MEHPSLGPGGYGRCPLAVEEEVEAMGAVEEAVEAMGAVEKEVEDSLFFETFIDRVLNDLRSVI